MFSSRSFWALLSSCLLLVGLSGTGITGAETPHRLRRAVVGHRVPGQYIVLLRETTLAAESVPLVAERLLGRHGGRVRIVLQNAAKGFSANLTEEEALRLSEDPEVLLVEENSFAYLSSEQSLPTDNSLWALDRIDQRTAIGGGDDKYRYCEKASGVKVYILDTGINRDHTEFLRTNGSSRVLNGVKFANDHWVRTGESDDYGTWPCGGWYNHYSAGHGTAVASLIGGKIVGGAKEVLLVPLRVFKCIPPSPTNPSGRIELATTEHLNWALDWIKSTSNPHRNHRPALVNISLRVPVPLPPPDEDLEGTLEAVINGLVLNSPGWTGIPVVVSANNQNTSQPCSTPARMAWSNTGFQTPGRVISAGAIQEADTRWVSSGAELYQEQSCNPNVSVNAASNFGSIVDIWAAGHNVKAAHLSSATAYRTSPTAKSGTSFSAAIVSGVVARILQANPTFTPLQVWNQLQTDATMIPPINGNGRLVYRGGAVLCSPELP